METQIDYFSSPIIPTDKSCQALSLELTVCLIHLERLSTLLGYALTRLSRMRLIWRALARAPCTAGR